MAKSQLTFKKKERAKKQLQKRQEKLEKRALNKDNNDRGKSLEELYAYVDEFGNISDKPPEKRYEFKAEDLLRPSDAEDEFRHGRVSYYNETGHYGFIRDNLTTDTVYFNDNLAGVRLNIDQPVKYKYIRTKQGYQLSELVLEK